MAGIYGFQRCPGSTIVVPGRGLVCSKPDFGTLTSCEGIVAVEKTPLGRDLGQSTGGYELVLSGVIFALAGLWLDKQVGTTPLLTIVLTVVGFGGSVANVYYRYQRDIERLDAEAEAKRRGGS